MTAAPAPPPGRILVLCPYPEGIAAAQRLKYEQYLDDWRAAGFAVTVSPYMDRALWDRVHAKGHLRAKAWGTIKGHFRRLRAVAGIRGYDLVYISMWVTPFGTTLLERLVRRLAPRVILDIEDNLLTDDGAPKGIRQRLKNRGKTKLALREADHIVTASPFLVEPYRTLNRRKAVTLIYPSVDTDRFAPAPVPAARAKPVIGWTGTFSSRPYLDLLQPVFLRLRERVDFTLLVIGNFDYAMPGIDLDVRTWSLESEVRDMQAMDIGVYPLPDDKWALGKAGLKVIQYMAFGVPSVSSAIGTALHQVEDGVQGYLVHDEDEWVDRLERLCRDPALRATMGAAGRREAVARYSRQATGRQYLSVIADTMQGGSDGRR